MIVWLLTVAARRKLTESSEVVTPTPGGALVSTAEPSAASATKAVVPARKTPAADCHQGLAGIQALAIARPTSDRRRPVSRLTGGSGSRRSRLDRSSSTPGSCSTSAPHVDPCGASRTVSGITSAAPSPKHGPSQAARHPEADRFHDAKPCATLLLRAWPAVQQQPAGRETGRTRLSGIFSPTRQIR